MKTFIKGASPYPIANISFQRFSILFSIFLITLSLSSCNLAYYTILGVDTSPDWLLKEDIEKISIKRNIPIEQSFLMNESSYFSAIHERAKQKIDLLKSDGVISPSDSLQYKLIKEKFKNDRQVVQVRYFKKTGEPIFKMLSCYLAPFPMSWNIEGSLDVFPPNPISDLKEEENDSLQFILSHITPLNGKAISMEELPKSDYYAVVFWNEFAKKASKKLIKQIQAYDQRHQNQETYFLYVNNQNAVLLLMLNQEQKGKIKEVPKESTF